MDIWEGGADVTTRPYPSLWGGGWDTDVVQISMKNCRNEASDNALESPSAAELVSIEHSGVGGYLGADVTIRSYPSLGGGGGGYRRRLDLHEKLPYQR